jgi:hypothetical protein
LENENIGLAQEQNNISSDLGYDGAPDNAQHEPNQSVENSEAQDVSRETNEYEESPISEREILLSIQRDLMRQQQQMEELKRERYGYQQPQQGNEEPLTARDIIRQEISDLQNEQWLNQQERQKQALDQEFNQKISTARTRFKDFDAVIGKIDYVVTPEMQEMFKTSDDPAAFAYHAARVHAEELTKISALPGPSQRREMVKLEEKIKSSLKPRTVSRAPSPLSETAGSAGLSGGFDVNDTDAFAKFLHERSKKR